MDFPPEPPDKGQGRQNLDVDLVRQYQATLTRLKTDCCGR